MRDLLAAQWLVPWLLIVLTAAAIALIREFRLRRRTEARNRAILSAAFADIAILGRDGVIEACNHNWHAGTTPTTPSRQGGQVNRG